MNDRPDSTRRARLSLAFLFLLTIIAGSAVAIGPSSSVAPGHWILSDDQGCPGNQVCTEWELANGEVKGSPCCMDPSLVGSSDPDACGTGEGQFRQ